MTTQRNKDGIFHAPLNQRDSETQTEGCRHTNPDICASHSLPKVCVFTRSDGLCLKPPASWPKQFKRLSDFSVKKIQS